MLDVSTKTVRRMVQERRFPRPVRVVKGRPRWLRSDVLVYLRAIRLGIVIDGREEAEGIAPEHPVKVK
jgi:hypothetical protein